MEELLLFWSVASIVAPFGIMLLPGMSVCEVVLSMLVSAGAN